jgi:hypothetical protein
MLIDAHVHLKGGALHPGVVEAAARLGIERLLVSSLGAFQYEPAHDQCLQANRETEAAMRRHPGLVLGACYVNPRFAQAADEAGRCVEAGMVAVKLWVAAPASDPCVFPVVEKAIALGVPILQHAWHKATGNLPHESTPSEVAALGRRYPEAALIMAHIGGDWERGLRAVRGVRNVRVDTSGSIIEAGMIEAAVEQLGAARVIFGSDADGVEPAVALAKITGAEISDEAKRLILGDNVAALLSHT